VPVIAGTTNQTNETCPTAIKKRQKRAPRSKRGNCATRHLYEERSSETDIRQEQMPNSRKCEKTKTSKGGGNLTIKILNNDQECKHSQACLRNKLVRLTIRRKHLTLNSTNMECIDDKNCKCENIRAGLRALYAQLRYRKVTEDGALKNTFYVPWVR